MSHRNLAVTGALLLSLAVPAGAAAAPTITSQLKPCYITAGTFDEPQGEPVTISGTGFTPNADVDVTLDGVAVPNGHFVTDGTGSFTGFSVTAPWIAAGQREFTITVTETATPANTVSVTSRTTALLVNLIPQVAHPQDTIRFKGSGFTQDKPVYAHYFHRGDFVKTVKMAGGTGRCGTWSARRRQIPARPKLGKWLVQFDQRKRFRDKPIYFRVRINVRRG